jgi:hypothetical protein
MGIGRFFARLHVVTLRDGTERAVTGARNSSHVYLSYGVAEL